MKTIRILDKTGDTCLEFDETTATDEQRAAAEKVFNEFMEKKLPAFMTKRANGEPDKKVTSFGDIEEGSEVILVPAIVAG